MIPLSQAELEVPRTAGELRPWVMSKIEEIGATEEGRWAIRMSKGYAKILAEESLPLGYFADFYYEASPNVTITQVVGSQSYDARILDGRKCPSSVEYVEITQAHEGENEYLRMVAMKENGHVSLLGKVRKQGSKLHGLKVEVESSAKRHSDVFDDQLGRIEAAVDRKCGKAYPPHTGLIIAFDDSIVFREQDELDRLEDWFRRELLARLSGFNLVALVGTSGDSYLGFEAGGDTI